MTKCGLSDLCAIKWRKYQTWIFGRLDTPRLGQSDARAHAIVRADTYRLPLKRPRPSVEVGTSRSSKDVNVSK